MKKTIKLFAISDNSILIFSSKKKNHKILNYSDKNGYFEVKKNYLKNIDLNPSPKNCNNL